MIHSFPHSFFLSFSKMSPSLYYMRDPVRTRKKGLPAFLGTEGEHPLSDWHQMKPVVYRVVNSVQRG